MGGFHGRPAYADVAVVRDPIVDMSARAAIDQIVANEPGMVARRSRLTQLARSVQGSVSGTAHQRAPGSAHW
jgi:hypothetical protein